MGKKVPPAGLILRGATWHIKKQIGQTRIRESCGTAHITEAERYLAHRMEEVRQAEGYRVRPKRAMPCFLILFSNFMASLRLSHTVTRRVSTGPEISSWFWIVGIPDHYAA